MTFDTMFFCHITDCLVHESSVISEIYTDFKRIVSQNVRMAEILNFWLSYSLLIIKYKTLPV